VYTPHGTSASCGRIFSDLAPFAIARLQSILHPVQLPQGTIICKQGERSTEAYILLHGQMEAQSVAGQRLAVIAEGSLVGELSMLGVMPERSCTLMALTNCECYIIFKSDLFQTFQDSTNVLDTMTFRATALALKGYAFKKEDNAHKMIMKAHNESKARLHPEAADAELKQKQRALLAKTAMSFGVKLKDDSKPHKTPGSLLRDVIKDHSPAKDPAPPAASSAGAYSDGTEPHEAASSANNESDEHAAAAGSGTGGGSAAAAADPATREANERAEKQAQARRLMYIAAGDGLRWRGRLQRTPG
jgi:CRP-like cAMP-binding protein